MPLKYPKKPKNNEREEAINNEIWSTFSEICSAATPKKNLDPRVRTGFSNILGK
mgnify:FL=1